MFFLHHKVRDVTTGATGATTVTPKTILRANAANFLQICVNPKKYWNNGMSIDGLIIEYMDLSHIHLAVVMNFNTCHFFSSRLPSEPVQ